MGFSRGGDDGWIEHQDAFDQILAGLNAEKKDGTRGLLRINHGVPLSPHFIIMVELLKKLISIIIVTYVTHFPRTSHSVSVFSKGCAAQSACGEAQSLLSSAAKSGRVV